MKLLLDSNVILWLIYSPEQIPEPMLDLLKDKVNERIVSDASIWEISLKLSKGRLEYTDDLTGFLLHIDDLKANALPITREHILASVQLPPIHPDPFDCLLVAQALAEKAVLLTSDVMLMRYKLPVFWNRLYA